MSESTNEEVRPRGIDAATRAMFLSAVREGAPLEAAAKPTGFTLSGFYSVRARKPDFKLAWEWALELSAADERAARGAAAATEGQETFILPNNKRPLQRRRMRHFRFTPRRQQLFLAHFAGSLDTKAAAEAAKIDATTVYKCLQRDPDFAAAYRETIEVTVPRLEAEALRQRLEAQRRLSEEVVPEGEMAQEFERLLKLLQRWDRKNGRAGPREVSSGRAQRWDFDEAIEAIARKLRAIGIPVRDAPDEEEDGEAENRA